MSSFPIAISIPPIALSTLCARLQKIHPVMQGLSVGDLIEMRIANARPARRTQGNPPSLPFRSAISLCCNATFRLLLCNIINCAWYLVYYYMSQTIRELPVH